MTRSALLYGTSWRRLWPVKTHQHKSALQENQTGKSARVLLSLRGNNSDDSGQIQHWKAFDPSHARRRTQRCEENLPRKKTSGSAEARGSSNGSDAGHPPPLPGHPQIKSAKDSLKEEFGKERNDVSVFGGKIQRKEAEDKVSNTRRPACAGDGDNEHSLITPPQSNYRELALE